MRHFLGLMLLISVIAFPLIADQPIITKITISGNHLFSDSTLRNFLNISVNDTLSMPRLTQGIETIIDQYIEQGYYCITISAPNIYPNSRGTGVVLSLSICEETPLTVEHISFSGNRYFSDHSLRLLIKTKQHLSFDTATIEQDLITIVAAYSQKGYPFSVASVDSINIIDHAIFLNIHIEERDFLRFTNLVYKGNTITKDETVKHITNFPPNIPYSEKLAKQAERRLLNRPYITKAQVIPRAANNIEIRIEESRMNHFQGILGFSSGEKESWRERLTGFIDFSFNNIMGTDRSIQVTWEHLSKENMNIDLSYREPFIANQQIAGEIAYTRKTIDTLYVHSDFSLSVFVHPYPITTLGGKIQKSSTLLNGKRTQHNGIGINADISTLDYPGNPRSGKKMGGEYTIKYRKQSQYHQIVKGKLAGILPLYHSFFLFFQTTAQGIYVRNETLSDYEYFRFGGYNSLRGFLEDQFISDKYVTATAEIRSIFSREGRIYLFTDYAYASEYDSLLGIGFGLRISSQIGVISVNYALSHQESKWSNISDGTLHFGVETTF